VLVVPVVSLVRDAALRWRACGCGCGRQRAPAVLTAARLAVAARSPSGWLTAWLSGWWPRAAPMAAVSNHCSAAPYVVPRRLAPRSGL